MTNPNTPDSADTRGASTGPGPRFGSWEQAVQWLRAQPDQAALVQSAYYDDPLLGAATRYWQSEEWRAVRGLLPTSRGLALDVGAGRGIASFALAKEGYRVMALEPDGSALVGAHAIRGLATETGLPIEVTQEFSECLPFADASFDLVFARAVLHHTSDLAGACREFFRVLKPGGHLLAIREHVISRPEDLPAFLDDHPLHHLYGGENAFLPEVYTAAIRGAGFALDAVMQPFDSAVNYAPYTRESLRREIALRVGARLPGLRPLVQSALSVPVLWSLGTRLMNRIDHRPGRLHSFHARKP
jgi:SAM-dependent methyltransferase